jgi:hypothetical protein
MTHHRVDATWINESLAMRMALRGMILSSHPFFFIYMILLYFTFFISKVAV